MQRYKMNIVGWVKLLEDGGSGRVLCTFHTVGNFLHEMNKRDRLCGLVVRVLGYRSGGSIPGTTRKKK
jgi:hypothetical protein